MSSVSATTSFKSWTEKNPNWKDTLGVYERDSLTYQRITCYCRQNDSLHEYHAVINVLKGDIYVDDSKRVIAFKHLELIVARPVHACVKTLWHASIIGPLAFEIFACLKKEQSVKILAVHMAQSMADIIRTPLYSVAIVIVHLAALVLGALAPRTFYHTRSAAGFLERKLLREAKVRRSKWGLSPCFSPISNINPEKEIKDVRASLTRLTRQIIQFKQEERLLPEDATYVSPVAERKKNEYLSEFVIPV